VSSLLHVRLYRALSFLALVLFLLPASAAPEVKIAALGTSFTNGRGVASSQAYPARLEVKLRQRSINADVTNMGVNGDTTVDLLNRLEKIPAGTDLVIYEFARGNDSRAGISEEITKINSQEIVRKLLGKNIKVLIVVRDQIKERLDRRLSSYAATFTDQMVEIISIHQPADKILHDREIWSHPTVEAHDEIAESMVAFVTRLLSKQ